MATAVTLYVVGIVLRSAWVRRIAAVLLFVTLIAGVDPAERLAKIGWLGR
jgi:hypothetical protein